MLLDRDANRLWAYNDTAQEIWDLIHDGRAEDAVADDIASLYGIDPAVVLEDVRRIVADWVSNGILRNGQGSDAPASSVAPAQQVTDWTKRPRPDAAWSFTCEIRRRIIAFHIEPQRTRTFVRMMYGHLAAPDAHPDATVELRDSGTGETALVVDGVERLRGSEAELIGGVNQAVLELVYPGIDLLAMIHGGAVARNGRGVGLPAASGSGKTTLIAHLLPRGWDYLSDDLIALSAPDGCILPLPLPLSIKEGSWDLLSGTYPDLTDAPNYQTARGPSRRLFPPHSAWDSGPVPLSAFVFPKYIAGAATTILRLTPLEALQRLLSDRIWLGYPLKLRQVEAFITWLDDRPAYDLVLGDAKEAARRIEEIA